MADLITVFPRKQTLAEAQPDLLANYGNINPLFGVDHADLLSPNAGLHNQVTMTEDVNSLEVMANMIALFASTSLNPLGFVQLLLKRGTAAPYFIDSTSTTLPTGNAACMKLPSGIIVKFALMEMVFNNHNGNITVPWSAFTYAGQNDIPFTNQYWAVIYPNTTPQGTDTNLVFYVTDLSVPTAITFRAWVRSRFNTVPAGIVTSVGVIAIGS